MPQVVCLRLDRHAEVSFPDGSGELNATGRFRQINKRYVQKILPASGNSYEQSMAGLYNPALVRALGRPSAMQMEFMIRENQSYFPVTLQIKNTGQTTIEDWKLVFDITGEWQDIRLSNRQYPMTSPKAYNNRFSSIHLSPQKTSGEIIPPDRKLVGDDIFTADPIFIKPMLTPTTLAISWKLLATDYKLDGQLLITVTPQIIVETEEDLTEDFLLVAKGPVKGPIEDFIELIKS